MQKVSTSLGRPYLVSEDPGRFRRVLAGLCRSQKVMIGLRGSRQSAPYLTILHFTFNTMCHNFKSLVTIWFHLVHLSSSAPCSTILHLLAPLVPIWHHSAKFGTIYYNPVPFCNIWHQMAPTCMEWVIKQFDHKWHRMVSNGIKLHQLAPNGNKLFRNAQSCIKLHLREPNIINCHQIILNDTQL